MICVACIFLFGCIQPETKTGKVYLCGEACEQSNSMQIQEINELKQNRLNDFQAMLVGLEGYAICHIAVSCELDPMFSYSGFACSDLNEDVLWEIKKECFVSENYFDYVSYVAGLEAEQGQ